MVSKRVVVRYPSGLELEQAGAICKKAMQYKSLITFAYPDGTANVKSVLSVLGSCVRGGDEVELFCDGVDEAEALQVLAELIAGGGDSL